MRALLLTLFLILTPVAIAQQQGVVEQVATADSGQPFIRLHNRLSFYVSCYYRDNYNYITFVIAPNSITQWQPIYGAYVWECR